MQVNFALTDLGLQFVWWFPDKDLNGKKEILLGFKANSSHTEKQDFA